MKKLVLNILSILAWIGEAITLITTVLLVFSGILTAIPSFRTQILKTLPFEISGNFNISPIIIVSAILLGAVGMFALFWIIRSFRLLIKNINHEIYFDQKNLKLLRAILVSLGVYTVADIAFECLIGFSQIGKEFDLDFADSGFSLVVLAIIYVIYLVFKNGLELKNETKDII